MPSSYSRPLVFVSLLYEFNSLISLTIAVIAIVMDAITVEVCHGGAIHVYFAAQSDCSENLLAHDLFRCIFRYIDTEEAGVGLWQSLFVHMSANIDAMSIRDQIF